MATSFRLAMYCCSPYIATLAIVYISFLPLIGIWVYDLLLEFKLVLIFVSFIFEIAEYYISYSVRQLLLATNWKGVDVLDFLLCLSSSLNGEKIVFMLQMLN